MDNLLNKEIIARRYDTGEPVCVRVSHEVIYAVRPLDEQSLVNQGLTLESLPWIAPGLFDIQVNGGEGIEFSSAELTVDDVAKVCKRMLHQGVFRFCPTITTNSSEILLHAARTIAETRQQYPEYSELITGIHLEGPFISSQDGSKGAHPREFCRSFDQNLFDELQQVSGDLIRIVTLSPEYEGFEPFITYLKSKGIVVAIGHTAATSTEIARAVHAGASLSTHLSNATTHLLPKLENYFFAQLTNDQLWASIIADSFHVSPMLLRIILRTKGRDRLILISDQASAAGLSPGRFKTNLCELEIMPDGRITLCGDDHLLAGASCPVSDGVANLMTVGELALSEVYPLATEHPAQLLQLPKFSNGNKFLEQWSRADLIVFQVRPAVFGTLGIADTAGFQRGSLQMESIVYQGREQKDVS